MRSVPCSWGAHSEALYVPWLLLYATFNPLLCARACARLQERSHEGAWVWLPSAEHAFEPHLLVSSRGTDGSFVVAPQDGGARRRAHDGWQSNRATYHPWSKKPTPSVYSVLTSPHACLYRRCPSKGGEARRRA